MEIIRILIGGLLGGGLIGFIEFLIRRKDERNDKTKEVLEAINKLDEKFDKKIEGVNERIETLEEKIDLVDSKVDQRNAISNRVRILRFADEMLEEKRHSKDSWDQVMSDTTEYEQYCKAHPEFKNNQTAATVEYIQKEYTTRLEKHDFAY